MQARWMLLAATLLLGRAAQLPGDPRRPPPTFDRTPPSVPATLHDGVLIFSKTNAYRHVEQIPHANRVLKQLARREGIAAYTTENAAIFNPEQLRRFRIIVLNSASGDLFTPEQRAAFLAWLTDGGTLIALHGAGGDKGQPWGDYVDRIIGARFIGHPNGSDQLQPVTIARTASRHPVMAGIPDRWRWTDELYSFDGVPDGPGTTILATLDEASYRKPAELVMGAVHPIIWVRTLGRGLIVFSALGHKAAAFDDPIHRRLLANAIRWAAHSGAGERIGSANRALP